MGSSLPLTLSPQINADLRAKNDPLITRIARNEEKEKNANDLYRGCYVEPDRISSGEANMSYKVIYCVASLK